MDRLEIFTRLADKTISKAEALALLRGSADLAGARASVRACVAAVLHIDASQVSEELSFSEMGVDSISGLEIVRDLNLHHDLNLDSTVLYDFPHIGDLAAHVADQRPLIGAGPIPRGTDQDAVRSQVALIVERVLHLGPDGLDPALTFQEMGFDSISGLELVRDCNATFGLNLDSVVIYDHPDLDRFSAHLASVMTTDATAPGRRADGTTNRFESEALKSIYHDEAFGDRRREFLRETIADAGTPPRGAAEHVSSAPPVSLRATTPGDPAPPDPVPGVRDEAPRSSGADHVDRPPVIAVVGMAGVFPDADDVDEFWDNLVAGVTSMRPVPPRRWRNRGGRQHYAETVRPALLDDIDSFDCLFFNISPVDAEVMDPQQRVFLQVAHHAFEDAGYPEGELATRRVGVFVGAAQGDYQKRFDGSELENQSQVFAGNASSILPARVSYFLDLHGPAVGIDTACSSSLVAVHYACQSLRSGEVDMALAGGIRLMVTDELYVQVTNAGMSSPSGECRAFDAAADGIAMGEAAAAVVLKRYDDAVADGDRIHGVILGSGVNQDGRTNGITAPSPRAQTELEVEVYERYGINPRAVTLVEAHGTGTALGDPIEVGALQGAFSRYTDETGFCELGSVKNNIGHTTMAAGISSLIKVLKAMEHETVPPLANFDQLNPKIDLAGGPFRITTTPRPWQPADGSRRTAALSSFGFSGTNCHVVIQEAR